MTDDDRGPTEGEPTVDAEGVAAREDDGLTVPMQRTDGPPTNVRRIYGDKSQAAHHRRKWTQDAVFPAQRTMLRGPTTNWARRAATTAAMLVIIEEAVMAVGDALGEFMEPGWYVEHVLPFLRTFEALRLTQPLV